MNGMNIARNRRVESAFFLGDEGKTARVGFTYRWRGKSHSNLGEKK